MAPAVKRIDTPCPANANAADTFPCRPNHKRIYANATIMTVNMAAIQNQRILRRLHGVVSPRNRFKPCTVLPPCHYCTASRERLVIYEDVRARESLGIRTPLGVLSLPVLPIIARPSGDESLASMDIPEVERWWELRTSQTDRFFGDTNAPSRTRRFEVLDLFRKDPFGLVASQG